MAGLVGLGGAGWGKEAEEFPRIEPAEARVDAEKLAKAVAFVEAEVKAGSMPGAALVATRGGRKFVEHYCGTYRGFDGADKPFGPGVSSALFSFSKGISATVAVMAHQDGLIDYDVPVSTYIPEFKGGGKDVITLRHLLTHSAGIPSVNSGPASTDEEWAAFLKTVCAAEIEWPVGSKCAYHAVSGMFVVAEAVRRVSGMKSWNDICRERLFEPIGAKSLAFGPFPADIPRAVTPGYFTSDKNGLGGHPAGGCFGTVDDMLRVLNLIVWGGTWGRSLLRPEARKEMLTVQYADQIAKAVAEGKTPVHESWGLGWLVRGTAPSNPAGYWFGFGDSKSPTLFGHAGVDTVYGDGDPARDLAYVFIITDKARNAEEATRLRREVSNLLQDAVLT
jgi:CubicO group peptidase (beta-lactamase class C family)